MTSSTVRAAGWAPNSDPFTRPYELRHSAGIALSDAGVDLADISGFLGHKDLRTTRQTYVPIRNARMQRASELLDGRFQGWNVPAAVPVMAADQGGSSRTNADRQRGSRAERKSRQSPKKSRRKAGGSA